METSKVITDCTTHIDRLVELKTWLSTLYYDAEFGAFYHRPILSLLIAGADYLVENLSQMKARASVR